MITLSWNCRELGNRCAVEVLTEMVRKQVPTILFLMETKLNVREMEPIKFELGFSTMLAMSCESHRGGLALLWKEEDVTIETQTYSPNHIDGRVHINGLMWRLTGIYGHLDEERKCETWRLMRHLHARASLPWICLRDFNEILSSDEKNGGDLRPMGAMMKFRQTLLHCGLVDLEFNGYRFTWRNGRGGEAFVEERLDRAVATSEWREMFPRTKVRQSPTSYLNHDPILMDMDPPTQPKKRRHKIQWSEEKWATHKDYEKIIRDYWNQTQPQGSPLYCLFEKIKRCRMNLIRWSRVTFGNARNWLDVRQGELIELMESGYGPNMERIPELKIEINELLHHEEVFWRQRSRSIWLSMGDKNTKFFHQRASQRRRKNNIEGVYDRFGVWQIEEVQIAKIVEEYYKQLYTSANSMDVEE